MFIFVFEDTQFFLIQLGCLARVCSDLLDMQMRAAPLPVLSRKLKPALFFCLTIWKKIHNFYFARSARNPRNSTSIHFSLKSLQLKFSSEMHQCPLFNFRKARYSLTDLNISHSIFTSTVT
jgi:hypothetical protein